MASTVIKIIKFVAAKRWRNDGKCGLSYKIKLPDDTEIPAECDPDSGKHCCKNYWKTDGSGICTEESPENCHNWPQLLYEEYHKGHYYNSAKSFHRGDLTLKMSLRLGQCQ